MNPVLQRKQLEQQRLQVDFDSYDITVDEMIRRVETGKVDIAPSYQRKFRWDAGRQSSLIESIFLGIPVPPLFMATSTEPNQAIRWEVVDGLQRVTTLVNFAGTAQARRDVNISKDVELKLTKLEKLTAYNGFTYNDLPPDIQSAFENRPLKVIVLNDKSEMKVRFDLFERLNTGGIRLSDQEVRECVFRGPFIELLNSLSQADDFANFVLLSQNQGMDGTHTEYVLRFFAYLNNYENFDHSVKGFLDDFCSEPRDTATLAKWEEEFLQTFSFLRSAFSEGLKGARKSTPVNLFEGVAVGAALALKERPSLKPPSDTSWTADDDLKKFVYGATNTKPRVVGRIEYCRDRFLGV